MTPHIPASVYIGIGNLMLILMCWLQYFLRLTPVSFSLLVQNGTLLFSSSKHMTGQWLRAHLFNLHPTHFLHPVSSSLPALQIPSSLFHIISSQHHCCYFHFAFHTKIFFTPATINTTFFSVSGGLDTAVFHRLCEKKFTFFSAQCSLHKLLYFSFIPICIDL